MKASLGLKNDENHRGFHLYLEILAQMFHAYHCQHDNGLPAFQTSLAKVRFV